MLAFTRTKPKPSNELPTQHLHTYQGDSIRKSVNPPNPVAKVSFYLFRRTNCIEKSIPKQTSQKSLILMVSVWSRASRFPSKEDPHL